MTAMHSRRYNKLKQELADKEKVLRSELESESELAGSTLVKQTKIFGSLIVGLSAGYLLYRLFFSSKKDSDKEHKEPMEVSVSKKSPFMDNLITRLSDEMVELIVSTITDYVNRKKGS